MFAIVVNAHYLDVSGWRLGIAVAIFVLMRAAAMDLEPLQQIVNDAILNCLELARIPIKEAASLAGMNESNFRKALSGEGYRNISLTALFKLPYRFWVHFGPMLMWLVAKKHAQEIAETFSVRKGA